MEDSIDKLELNVTEKYDSSSNNQDTKNHHNAFLKSKLCNSVIS